MTDYLALAGNLAGKAPAQARLLRHILVNPGQTTPQILTALNYREANFRHLVGKLRDRGVEIVTTRVLEDPTDQTTAKYIWSIRSDEQVEHWAGGRQGSVNTAWKRVRKMMESHLASIPELDRYEQGVIGEALRRVTEDIERIDVYAQVKIEEAKAEAAAIAAEREGRLHENAEVEKIAS